MAHAGIDDGYEWALSRLPQLEVDLASAVTALEQAQADNAALREIHSDLVRSYKRLKDSHAKQCAQSRRDHEEARHTADLHRHELDRLRQQLEAKTLEVEAVPRGRQLARELDSMRLQLAEEIEVPFRERLKALEAKVVAAERKAQDAHRQMEATRVQAGLREDELKDDLASQSVRHRQQEEMLERKVASLDQEVRRQAAAAADAAAVWRQLEEQHVKVERLQQELADLEQQGERERNASDLVLKAKDEDLAVARRRAHALEAQAAQEERRREAARLELDGLLREKAQLAAKLDQAEAKLSAWQERPASSQTAPQLEAELSRTRMAAAAEREKLVREAASLEEQVHAANGKVRRLEAQVKQMEEEREIRDREAQQEKKEVETRLSTELATLKAQLQAAETEVETKRQAMREKEATLTRQADAERTRAEALGDDLVSMQQERDDAQRSLREIRKQEHRQQQELTSLKDRAERAEKTRAEQAVALEHLTSAKRKEEKRAEALQNELATISRRLDEERTRWSREMDEQNAATLKTEEERRTQAMQRLQDEHRRQLAKYQTSAKKALQKCALKRQELRTRCSDLAKKVAQLQHDKASVVRICEENKGAYELRLAELGVAVTCASRGVPGLASLYPGVGSHSASRAALIGPVATSVASCQELRGISERLEKQTEWLRARGSPAALAGLSTSMGAAKASALGANEALRISTVSNPQA